MIDALASEARGLAHQILQTGLMTHSQQEFVMACLMAAVATAHGHLPLSGVQLMTEHLWSKLDEERAAP